MRPAGAPHAVWTPDFSGRAPGLPHLFWGASLICALHGGGADSLSSLCATLSLKGQAAFLSRVGGKLVSTLRRPAASAFLLALTVTEPVLPAVLGQTAGWPPRFAVRRPGFKYGFSH